MAQESQGTSSAGAGTGGSGAMGTGGGAGGQGVGSPITNEAYNVLTALQAKLEGLEAYRKYSKDADAGLWQQLTQVEVQGVELLVGELERLVREGKFRTREPGKANG
ncbi:MAG TPA: hypothetical protein VE093_47665 [Polyangiaceae bacterium]|nr:hypothetical protein [Polyangiaceae bacterium]